MTITTLESYDPTHLRQDKSGLGRFKNITKLVYEDSSHEKSVLKFDFPKCTLLRGISRFDVDSPPCICLKLDLGKKEHADLVKLIGKLIETIKAINPEWVVRNPIKPDNFADNGKLMNVKLNVTDSMINVQSNIPKEDFREYIDKNCSGSGIISLGSYMKSGLDIVHLRFRVTQLDLGPMDMEDCIDVNWLFQEASQQDESALQELVSNAADDVKSKGSSKAAGGVDWRVRQNLGKRGIDEVTGDTTSVAKKMRSF